MPDAATLAAGVRERDRAVIARAITVVESTRTDHRAIAAELLADLQRDLPAAVRLGITGVPGVGKSTFIDQLGSMLTSEGHRVAVLAVDPSSTRTRGVCSATRPGWSDSPMTRLRSCGPPKFRGSGAGPPPVSHGRARSRGL
jgi:putative protein kinase ArgK-like GTPase of G3E family